MIDAKDAHYLTIEVIKREKLKALDEVEKKINEAINKGEFTVTIDDVFLNEHCIGILKDNGYVLEYFNIPYKNSYGFIISW